MNEPRHIPLIRLYGNIIVPVQITLSDALVEQLTANVTEAIEEGGVSGLIIDFSGADVMDSYITRRVRDLALAARVMGVTTIICGVRSEVVIVLIEMGLSVEGVRSALNLERALELLPSRRREVHDAVP